MKQLAPGESTGYHRRFVAAEPTWIGIVPVGYADGFRRDARRARSCSWRASGDRSSARSRWTRSPSRSTGPVEPGTPVTLIGDGLLAEEHAAAAGTISYELVARINGSQARATRRLSG